MSCDIADFHSYADNVMGNRMPQSEIFNGHTTFLMCNRNNREDIRTHRMNWLITNYLQYDCEADVKKDLKDIRDVYKDYHDYYNTNISDSYSGRFDPPGCFYNYLSKLDDMDRVKYIRECEERYNDDIEMHYRDISNRYNATNQHDATLSDEDFEETYESDGYDTGYVTQSEVIDEYDEYDDFDDYYDETEIEDDYNDW